MLDWFAQNVIIKKQGRLKKYKITPKQDLNQRSNISIRLVYKDVNNMLRDYLSE